MKNTEKTRAAVVACELSLLPWNKAAEAASDLVNEEPLAFAEFVYKLLLAVEPGAPATEELRVRLGFDPR